MYTKLKILIFLAIVLLFPMPSAFSQENAVQSDNNKITIRQAFVQIKSQMGYSIFYDNNGINLDQQIKPFNTNADVNTILDVVLKGTGYTYKISSKNIAIVKAPETTTTAQNKELSKKAVPVQKQAEIIQKNEDHALSETEKEPDYIEEETIASPVIEIQDTEPFEADMATIFKNDIRHYDTDIALKTNILYWATTTPNMGIEFAVSEKVTLELSGGYNSFKFRSKGNSNPKLMHWSVMPEARYWFCNVFEGTFLGVHGIYSRFNVEDIPVINKPEYRSKGYAIGGGLNIGHHWAMGKSWGFEMSAGIGALYLNYDKYECGACGAFKENKDKVYFGPTKCSISFLYFIR